MQAKYSVPSPVMTFTVQLIKLSISSRLGRVEEKREIPDDGRLEKQCFPRVGQKTETKRFHI